MHQDISRPEATLLVDRDEKGCSKLRGTLPYLSEGKKGTSEAGGPVATITHSNMEMGSYYHGFHRRYAVNPKTS